MSASPLPTATPDSEPIDLGDLVDPDHEADIEAESEDTLEYFSGYFYPVSIGDLFKQRYQIVHKLGRDGFSTVWLAQDNESGKAVALKILCSSASSDDEYEAHIDIAQRARDRSRLVLCQDKFELSRMHRNVEHKYRVLVLPLRGPSLHMGFQGVQTPLAHRMSAGRHLLQAILSIHEAGLVHRDIVPRNVVYGLNVDLGKMSITDKYKLLGRPRKGRIFEDDEVVGEIVAPAEFPLRVLGSDAYLCDFGILVKAGTSVPNKLQSPAGYCAPELFHDIEPSFASDIWSYMVVFVYLYTSTLIFDGRGFAGTVSSIVQHVGVLPPEWKDCYVLYDKEEVHGSWYGQGSEIKDSDGLSAFLDQHRPDISANEKALALSVFRQVFRPRLEDRATASELLDNQDFNALMGMYGV